MNARTAAYMAIIVILVIGSALAYRLAERQPHSPLRELMGERGKIAVLGPDDMLDLKVPGTVLVPVSTLPRIERLINNKDDGEALARAMTRTGVDGILVAGDRPDRGDEKDTLVRRLTRYEHVPFLRARFLASEAALFQPYLPPDLAGSEREALAVVARAVLNGARAPKIHSFPERLRETRDVEVLVLLSEKGRPRLWRSARKGSVAQALLTAAGAARARWMKRERLMGGRLDDRLPFLDVDVALLEDDGTVATRCREFIERVSGPEHGVAFEKGGTWRYLLPEARRRLGGGSAFEAYQQLLQQEGLPVSALNRDDIRLYRLVVVPLAHSPAPGQAASARE